MTPSEVAKHGQYEAEPERSPTVLPIRENSDASTLPYSPEHFTREPHEVQTGVENHPPGETGKNDLEETVAILNAGRLLQDADDEYQLFQETISIASSEIDTASVFNEARKNALREYYSRGTMQYQGPESVDDLPRSQRPERFVEPHPIFQFGQAVARVVGNALGHEFIRNMANVAREPDLMSAPSSADSNARFENRANIADLKPLDPWVGLGSAREGAVFIPEAINKLPPDVQAYQTTPVALEKLCKYAMAYDAQGAYPGAYYPKFSRDAKEW